jgi:hypothetical protein
MIQTSPQKTYASLLKFNARAALAKRSFKDFILYTKPEYHFNWHHEAITNKLEQFARGEIKKLMLFVPPQHGKSELSTRRLPAFMLGLNPNQKIAICSYSATMASSFNRDIQRIIDDQPYSEVFPQTTLNENSAINPSKNTYLRNSETFEIIGHEGFVKTVGVGGSLTGTPVDIGIIDDPFKDREEAMSNTIREKVYNWYTDVFSTRLHNDSQQLLIMTRWHQDDLAGRILQTDNDWEVIVFQAIKERESKDDPRIIGEALWPEKHSLERLLKIKNDTPITFNSLYQQEPKANKTILIFPEWTEIEEMPNFTQQFGVDFGFPTGIIEVMWHNKNLYLNEIMYDQTNPTNREILTNLDKRSLNLSRPYVCDSAETRSIKDLKDGIEIDGIKKKMNAIEAIKGPGSITFGLRKMQECKIFVTKWSHNLKNELNNYTWVTHNGKPTDEPIDAFNHLIDAARYCYATLGIKKQGTVSTQVYQSTKPRIGI